MLTTIYLWCINVRTYSFKVVNAVAQDDECSEKNRCRKNDS